MAAERTQWHELCATFSVRDHLHPGAFIPEVLLYDRLIIPVMPREHDGISRAEADEERERWKDWDPDRQSLIVEKLKSRLGDRIIDVPWTKDLRDEWSHAMDETSAPENVDVVIGRAVRFAHKNGYWETGRIVQKFAPAMAKTVVAVSSYRSLDDLTARTGIRSRRPNERVEAANLLAVLGFELLVPDDDGRAELAQLDEAAKVATDPSYREKRTALYQWQQQFIKAGKTDAASIETAVEHMHGLVQKLHEATRWRFAKRILSFFKIGADVAEIWHPVAGKILGAGVAAAGEFVADGGPAASDSSRFDGPAASLILDLQKRRGLTVDGERAR